MVNEIEELRKLEAEDAIVVRADKQVLWALIAIFSLLAATAFGFGFFR